jgi:hypothetical protein
MKQIGDGVAIQITMYLVAAAAIFYWATALNSL